MLYIWKTKVCFFKQSLFVFFKQSLFLVILKLTIVCYERHRLYKKQEFVGVKDSNLVR